MVSISGEVHFPGKYPMNSGMTVGDLIVAAGGLKDSAFSLAAEISRIGVDFNKTDVEALVEHRLLESLLTEDSLNEQLQPGDVLSVKKIPSWQDDRIITLTGEVKFPGEYAIRKNEKIGEVLERAGGLTRIHLREVQYSEEIPWLREKRHRKRSWFSNSRVILLHYRFLPQAGILCRKQIPLQRVC